MFLKVVLVVILGLPPGTGGSDLGDDGILPLAGTVDFGFHLFRDELSSDGRILFRSATRRTADRHLVEAEGLQLLQTLDAALGRADDGEAVDEVVGQRAGLPLQAAGSVEENMHYTRAGGAGNSTGGIVKVFMAGPARSTIKTGRSECAVSAPRTIAGSCARLRPGVCTSRKEGGGICA